MKISISQVKEPFKLEESVDMKIAHISAHNLLEQMHSLDKKEEPTFNRPFVATLAGISYSTLRGIMFEKLFHSSWVP